MNRRGPGRAVALAAAAIGAMLARLDARPLDSARSIAVAGCAAMVEANVCELPVGARRMLSIWISGQPSDRISVHAISSAPSRVVPHRAEQFPSGLRVDVPVLLDADTATLELRAGRERTLVLALRAAPSWPWQREVEKASSHETMDALGARLDHARGAERSKLLRALAESAMALGDAPRAFSLLREGASVASRARRYSEARSHWLRQAYHRAMAHDFRAAELALASARAVPGLEGIIDADGEAATAYVDAIFSAQLRDLPAAARAYERAQVWVERGAELMAPQIAVGRASIAEQQGRLADAVRLLEDASQTELATTWPCFRALVTARLGWYELQDPPKDDPGRPGIPRALQRLERASTLYTSECKKAPPEEVAWAALYLGFGALALGDVARARVQLERLGQVRDAPRVRLWSRLLEAEILFAGTFLQDAEDAFLQLEAAAERLRSSDVRWRAMAGGARVLLARGRLEQAVQRFEQAEALLAESIEWIPLDGGVLQFLKAHGETAAGLAKALLQQGRAREALAAARRARRRAMARLARNAESPPPSAAWQGALGSYLAARHQLERIASKLESCPLSEQALLQKELTSSEEEARRALERLIRLTRHGATYDAKSLREPAADEALLLWTEIDRRWHGFFYFSGQVRHASVAQQPQGQGWLENFEPWLAHARRLTVLPEGAFAQVDVHALAIERYPELEVAYSLDVPAGAQPAHERNHDVLAGDALGDLPHARTELELIHRLLRRVDDRVEILIGSALRGGELANAVAGARRLHYAGHARFLGVEGWQSQLSLWDGEIRAGDILSWSHVPDEVVLSACDAAREPAIVRTTGLGLAQAFLLAGSRAVVAPSRPVSDVAARRFSLELWRRLAAGRSLEAAYQSALAAFDRADEANAFRLLVR